MSPGIHSGTSETSKVRCYDKRQTWRAPRGTSNGPKAIIDKFAIVPIAACFFALIVYPLLIFYNPSDPHAMEGRPETRFFWPAVAAISFLTIIRDRSRLTLPPHIICLLAYLAFAGASVLWAFSPERSFIRYLQQAMIVTSIIIPVLLTGRTVDLMRALFLCLAFALTLNVFFVLGGSSDIQTENFKLVNIGYRGYFSTKNQLGECASVAFLLSVHEILQRGWRRAFGLVIVLIATLLVFLSNSKTAFALALICPLLAWILLLLRKTTRVSPAIVVLSIVLFYTFLSNLFHYDTVGRVSYILYHDSTLTGRTIIWDFAKDEIARRPLLGWGYQSFWFVPESPSIEAPGFVKMMPNAHNGYYDTMLEMGYAGLALLLVFIVATLHAVGRVADRDLSRARLLLSIGLFFILYNFFESLWMRAFEFLWVVFLITTAEIGRYWRPLPLRRSGIRFGEPKATQPDPSPGARGSFAH
jgi:exopolysaccharide production protein ExoQ